jgi:hypothetical protein
VKITHFGVVITLLMISWSRLFSAEPSLDYSLIDDYLSQWDRFAQGQNDLAPTLKADKARFCSELATAVHSNSKKAMGRAVFYDVVQVGGFIAYDSSLGQAIAKVVGPQVAVSASESGEKSYFAGDLYFWWEAHKKDYEDFPLYDDFMRRDFAKKTVIPMYTVMAKNSGH